MVTFEIFYIKKIVVHKICYKTLHVEKFDNLLSFQKLALKFRT